MCVIGHLFLEQFLQSPSVHTVDSREERAAQPLPRIPPHRPVARSRRGSGVDAGGHRERGAAAAKALPRSRRPGPRRPAMADSGGADSSGPWWKSLTNSRKKSKEAIPVRAQPPEEPAPPAPPSPDWTSSSRENERPSPGEPNKPDKMSAEKSGNSRRSLKISRSGRFKEKRKMRATLLPEGVRSLEAADFAGDPYDDKQ
ncbi:LOW QUALITY PROTEIN: proline-rich protein 15 [Pteropus medius]|uniref:LOW QUALITY PROTEIN: proline-rich protein 15 n=1 Tax=Pteropus vampyrus TaxID=132908 RepID=UPI00196BB25B|nr:LOW QUALITY PROTEIN: proline-rich protein 15 [Pteropus giganteus]